MAQGVLPVGIADRRARLGHAHRAGDLRAADARGSGLRARWTRSARWRCTSIRWSTSSRPGLSREGDVIWGNLEFLDGTRGAHVNISGISGVATKTSCAMFLLYSLFHSDALGMQGHNARAVIFNVKGEDLMFADKPQRPADARGRAAVPGARAAVRAVPGRRAVGAGLEDGLRGHALARLARRRASTAYVWSLREFCQSATAAVPLRGGRLGDEPALVRGHDRRALPRRRDAGQPTNPVVGRDRRASASRRSMTWSRTSTRTASRSSRAGTSRSGRRTRSCAGCIERGRRRRAPDPRGWTRDEDEKRHRIDWSSRQLNVIDIHAPARPRASASSSASCCKRLLEEKDQQGTRAARWSSSCWTS